VRQTGEPWEGREIPMSVQPQDGGEARDRYLDFVYQPVRGADGAIAGFLFSGYDVTDRHAAREESDRLRHQLLHSSRASAMGTMAVTIAHELNQPLTAAANYLSTAEYFLGRHGFDDEEREALDSARDQMLRAGDIVRQMRALVHVGPARAVPFDLKRSVERAVELVRSGRDFEGFAIDVDVSPEARLALGDDVQIEQVLVNLLRNAAEASAASPGRAAALTVRKEDGMIALTLRDWGPGLPPERMDNLFDALDAPARGGGPGVGLSLSRTIVEAHGGQIRGENVPDGGALFGFTLPMAEEAKQPA